MGQNFLVEWEVVQRIVEAAGIGPDDRVVEIGPGLGILTQELLATGCQLVAVEMDDELAVHLESTLGTHPQFTLIHGDALQVPIDSMVSGDTPYLMVANLPYSVGTGIIRRFLESSHPPKAMTVMLQQEVAERLVATPPHMSMLSIATQIYADGRLEFIVPPDAFIPAPEITSAVITLESHEPSVPAAELDRFFAIVSAGFRQKRKTVANSLSEVLGLDKQETTRWLASAGVDPRRRAQTLSIDEWRALLATAPVMVGPS